MQPDHFGAERDGFGEQLRIGRQRNAQAGTDEIELETRREGRMRHDGSDVGHDILSRDRLAENLREVSKKCRLDVRLRRGAVEPEWMHLAGE